MAMHRTPALDTAPTRPEPRRPQRPAPTLTGPVLQPGSVVADTYRILGPIGSGGMGVVWLARDEQLQRDVALKVIRADVISSPLAHARFLEEARSMARVRHPNVVE